MRRRLILVAQDLYRFCPLAIVGLATLVSIPSLRLLARGELDATQVLERYALALILASVAMRTLTRMVLRYAASNVLAAERRRGQPNPGEQPPPRPSANPSVVNSPDAQAVRQA